MRPTEIKDLVVGLTVIVSIALALGQFDRLHDFARRQAAASLKGWKTHPFFPEGYEVGGKVRR